MNLLSKWRLIWQKNKGEQLGCSLTMEDGSVFQPEPIQSSGILHRSCKTLSLAAFINIYCHDAYYELGTGTQEQIDFAWAEIVSEWSDLMRNEKASHLISIKSQILELKKHISFVDGAYFFLTRRYDKEIVERLIKEGYPGEYPDNNMEALTKQMETVKSLCKTNIYDLWDLVEEEQRLEKNNMGAKSSEEDFVKNIMRLSKYQGYRINKNEITVFEYANIHNNFIDEIKLSTAQQTT